MFELEYEYLVSEGYFKLDAFVAAAAGVGAAGGVVVLLILTAAELEDAVVDELPADILIFDVTV